MYLFFVGKKSNFRLVYLGMMFLRVIGQIKGAIDRVRAPWTFKS